MTTEDRIAQISWLNKLAARVAKGTDRGTAQERVNFTLSDRGARIFGLELPEWFSDKDKEHLVTLVEGQLRN